MLNITFIALSLTFSNSMIIGAHEAEKIPENNQNGWLFNFTNLPIMGWLQEQMYVPPRFELNPKDESQSTKLLSEIEDLGEGKILTNSILNIEELPDEPKSSMNVEDILEIIKDSSDEEKKRYMPFLKKFLDTITDNPARYVKIFIKDTWHLVDMGIFKSGERRRNVENVKSLYETIRDFVFGIFRTIYDFFMGRVKAGQIGTQKGWAAYERKTEGDLREWTEEEALERLNELETQYTAMNKEELTKDITSLCMQPLFTPQTYEKIVTFLDKLKTERVIEIDKLDKAFEYVVRYFTQNIIPKSYKGQFAREHDIT